MKKGLRILTMVGFISIVSSMTSMANWEQVGTQWKYSENGIYLSGWQWIDGNVDGVSECYYLDSNGVMAVNTTIEGFTVDINGAWVVNNVVQTKVIASSGSSSHSSGGSSRSESNAAQSETENPGSNSSGSTSNNGMPSFSDISNGTVDNSEWGELEAGDSTGLPAMH